jgi:hypothetical protein
LSTISHGDDFIVPAHDFNEFGGGINYPGNDIAEEFLSVVSPKRFKIRIINKEKIKNKIIIDEKISNLKDLHYSFMKKLKKDVEKKWENQYKGMKNKAELMEQLYRAALEEIEYTKNGNRQTINTKFENNWEKYIQDLEYKKLKDWPF